MKVAAALLAAALALALGPGCDTTFGTLTLIDAGIQSGITVVEGGPASGEDWPDKEPEPGGD